MGALAADRQVAAVAQATVATQIHQALDVHLHFTAQVAFDGVVLVDVLADLQDFGVGQFVDPAGLVDADGIADGAGRCVANSGDVGEGDGNPLCSRDVYAGNTCHVIYSFSLRVRSSRPFFHNISPRR